MVFGVMLPMLVSIYVGRRRQCRGMRGARVVAGHALGCFGVKLAAEWARLTFTYLIWVMTPCALPS
jgi:hypothetical protein